MRFLGDVNARARGLQTHLLQAPMLHRLAEAENLTALGRELQALGFVGASASPVDPASLELGVRRHAADAMRTLARWSQERDVALAVIFEDEDRRSIEALLRGAVQGVAAEHRLAGLVPTERLPERLLQALAAQPTVKELVSLLVLSGHPLGRSLVAPAKAKRPSLFDLESELHRAFAARSLENARRSDTHLRGYVRQLIDLLNGWAALLHVRERDASLVDRVFVQGGAQIDRPRFRRLMALPDPTQVRVELANAFKGSSLAAAFRLEDLSRLETTVLSSQITEQSAHARLDPLGSAPLIAFALRLRAQVLNLRRIIWGVALGAPAPLIEAELVAA